MGLVINKKALCHIENFNHFFEDLQGITGTETTLFNNYNTLAKAVENNIDETYREFLAYPVLEGNAITFFGKKYEETPRLLSELSKLQDDDWEKYSKIKKETIAHYESKIESIKAKSKTLRNEGKTVDADNKTITAEYLTKAIKIVDDRFVYCYDNIVVLGVWGMQLRDGVNENISEICKTLTPPPVSFTVYFNAGQHGNLTGASQLVKNSNERITSAEIPAVQANNGYRFTGWDADPNDCAVTGDMKFTAQYGEETPETEYAPYTPPKLQKLPWYMIFWDWLRSLSGRDLLKWAGWLLLLLALLYILSLLVRNCNGLEGEEEEDVYDMRNPYRSAPAPRGYGKVLPPKQGVLPPVDDNPDIIPGDPSILADRLNILMENEDKSIMKLAKDFKEKYPDKKYKVIYYDDIVKRMQIKVPREEREQLKRTIPKQFAPEYTLFVFDEALFEGSYTPNDPAFADPEKSWYLKAINAPQAWDITRGSEKITIAIVDNGFNLKHPELRGKVVKPYNVWTHSGKIFPQQIDHGTHVAGTALAIADNGKGICGIAPNCKFMPVQVADKRGIATTTSVLDGILYALYQGADVINVSMGGHFEGISKLSEGAQQDLIRNHFKEEERLWHEIMRIAARHNSVIVISAGNYNVLAGIEPLHRPELFITVSAVDRDNKKFDKAGFSNYGQFTTISAPGVGIYSSVGKNEYQTMGGTSMSAPIVSGAVALMKSIDSAITTRQIIDILQSTGIETRGNIGKLIQLDKALMRVKASDTLDYAPVPSTGDIQILLNWNNYNDLDLICTDPSGESVSFHNRRVSSGGQLEIDMNAEYPGSKTPVENIYWGAGSAPDGEYRVSLVYFRKHEPAIDETPYNIKVKYGEKTEDYSGTIKRSNDTVHICFFTLEARKQENETEKKK
jgi:subtilisin family serine protease